MCAKYYELGYMFYKIAPGQSWRVCLIQRQNSRYFLVSGLKDEKLVKKSKPTRKLKHTNPIIEYFEYLCQMSSKSVLIILSYRYTVSNLARFLRHTVDV